MIYDVVVIGAGTAQRLVNLEGRERVEAVVIADVCGTGVDVVATRNIRRTAGTFSSES